MDLILFHDMLYVADDLLKSKRKVLKKLKQGKLQHGVCVITLPLGDEDMLEIYPSYILLQKIYKELDITVVGVAGEQSVAISLVERMTMDCLKTNSDANVRAFFEKDICP